jgi:hypothetical protein
LIATTAGFTLDTTSAILGNVPVPPPWPGGSVNVKPGWIGDAGTVVVGVVVEPVRMVGRRSQETPVTRISRSKSDISRRDIVFIVRFIITNNLERGISRQEIKEGLVSRQPLFSKDY